MEEIQKYITQQIEANGLGLVQLRIAKKDRLPLYKVVVYRQGGTGIDDCARVHRLLQTGLNELLGHDDFYLEVASPGIDWALSSEQEYRLFIGRGLSISLKDGGQLGGILAAAEGQTISIDTETGRQQIPLSTIHGARLDCSREGR